MTAAWSVVMVLLGLWPGHVNEAVSYTISVPVVDGSLSQGLQESLLQEFSLQQAA